MQFLFRFLYLHLDYSPNPKHIKIIQMNLLKLFFVFLTTIVTTLSFCQLPRNIFNEVTGEEFNTKDFTNHSKPIKQLLGAYHFGDSDSEWDLVVLQIGDSLILQAYNGIWGKEYYSKQGTWLLQCQTFNKVSVAGSKFYFGKYSGQFVEFKEENRRINAILLYCDLMAGRNYGKDSADVGFYSSNAETFFSDNDYYQLSIAVQPDSYFSGKTKQELKIMRNTIFARYGLILQPGGEMEKYFEKKDWYRPFKKDVSDCLTQIELLNLEAISKFEKL